MPQNFEQWFKNLQTLFYGLIAGQIIMALVLYVAVPMPAPPAGVDWTLYLLPVMALQAALGFWLSRVKIASAREMADLPAKLGAYRAALLLKWALLEAPTMIALILCFFVSAQPLLLVAAAILLGVSIIQRPSRDGLLSDLEMSAQEQAQLDDPSFLVTR